MAHNVAFGDWADEPAVIGVVSVVSHDEDVAFGNFIGLFLGDANRLCNIVFGKFRAVQINYAVTDFYGVACDADNALYPVAIVVDGDP